MLLDLNDIDLIKGITRKEAKAVHKDLPEGGVWRTIKGHHVYIKDGKVLAGSIPGVTKAKKATKAHIAEHQATIDREAKKGTKKNAKVKGSDTGKTAKSKPQRAGDKKTGAGASGAKKAGKDSTGGKTAKQVNKKAPAKKASKPLALYHGTTAAKAKKIVSGGFKVGGGHEFNYGDAVYFKSPEHDQKGDVPTKHVMNDYGQGAVIKAHIDPKHILDVRKKTPKELEDLLEERDDFDGDGNLAGFTDKYGVESPYEVYAKKHGIKAIIGNLSGQHGTEIGVYDPSIISISGHGKDFEEAEKLEPKGKANGTTKVGAKTDGKSKSTKPTAKSKPTGKPVSATGKKKPASEGGAKSKPAAKAGGGHYELYHGTKLWSVDDILKNGFEVNGHAEDFGNAAYFKSPQFDDLDRKDMENWKKEMEAKGRNISDEDRNNKDGYDTTKIVKYFAGSGNNSAVIKASIPKEHVVDCTKGRPKELESILKDYYKAQGDYVDLMKLAMKHILKMKNPTDEDAEDDRLTWELEQAWGKRFNTRETSPYEIYAKGYGVKAIIDKLDSFTSEGWQIGVYDPKIIKVHDHGWGIERSSRGVDLLKALMKALNGRNPGHCLLHFEMTDEGLVMHIGAIGKPKVPENVKKSLMKKVLAEGKGDVSAVYSKELRKVETAMRFQKSLPDILNNLWKETLNKQVEDLKSHGVLFNKTLTTGVQRKRSAYQVNWMAFDEPVDELLYIPLNRLNVVYQTEAATDWDKVNENADKMKRGVPLAPVVIGLDYDIHDGHHRYEASKMLGYEHVPCIVKGGSDVDRRRALEAYQEVWKSIVTDPTAPHQYDNEGFMFRGIGLRELHAINKSKVIQSKGKGNDDDKGTNTCFSNLYRQAEGYARSQYDLYGEKAAFVLVVNRVSWIEEDEHGELISDRPIPSTNIYDIIPVKRPE